MDIRNETINLNQEEETTKLDILRLTKAVWGGVGGKFNRLKSRIEMTVDRVIKFNGRAREIIQYK